MVYLNLAPFEASYGQSLHRFTLSPLRDAPASLSILPVSVRAAELPCGSSAWLSTVADTSDRHLLLTKPRYEHPRLVRSRNLPSKELSPWWCGQQSASRRSAGFGGPIRHLRGIALGVMFPSRPIWIEPLASLSPPSIAPSLRARFSRGALDRSKAA